MTMDKLKPAEKAERILINGIMENEYPVGSALPAERQLAEILGVTRPTLREALQRMGRDGWLEISQGKPTLVKDYLKDGSLGVLQSLISDEERLPEGFIAHVLLVRALLAPTYAAMAVEQDATSVMVYLEELVEMTNSDEANAAAYADGDGGLHKLLADLSGNPIFSFILNGFLPLYPAMGRAYFSSEEAKLYSKKFYEKFLKLAKVSDVMGVKELVDRVMQDAIKFWQNAN